MAMCCEINITFFGFLLFSLFDGGRVAVRDADSPKHVCVCVCVCVCVIISSDKWCCKNKLTTTATTTLTTAILLLYCYHKYLQSNGMKISTDNHTVHTRIVCMGYV